MSEVRGSEGHMKRSNLQLKNVLKIKTTQIQLPSAAPCFCLNSTRRRLYLREMQSTVTVYVGTVYRTRLDSGITLAQFQVSYQLSFRYHVNLVSGIILTQIQVSYSLSFRHRINLVSGIVLIQFQVSYQLSFRYHVNIVLGIILTQFQASY